MLRLGMTTSQGARPSHGPPSVPGAWPRGRERLPGYRVVTKNLGINRAPPRRRSALRLGLALRSTSSAPSRTSNAGSSPSVPATASPRVHKALSLLKRWLLGTHQGAISHEHLDYYLDEFIFLFN